MQRLHPILIAGALALTSVSVWARVQTFSLQVGPPVAAMPGASGTTEKKVGKDIVFVLRPTGCADSTSVRYTGTAHVVVEGVRRSWALPIGALTPAGVVGVTKTWLERGPWVALVSATCGTQEASVVARIVDDRYRRESVEVLNRRTNAADVDRAMALLAQEPVSAPPR